MSAASLQEDDIIASINVTPLVDIMLVLLIVFMLTTSLMQYPVVPVELPRAQVVKEAPSKHLAVVIDADNRIFVNGTEKTYDETKRIMEDEVRANPEVAVMLSADGNIKYQQVMTVMDLTKIVGVKNLSLQVKLAEAGK